MATRERARYRLGAAAGARDDRPGRGRQRQVETDSTAPLPDAPASRAREPALANLYHLAMLGLVVFCAALTLAVGFTQGWNALDYEDLPIWPWRWKRAWTGDQTVKGNWLLAHGVFYFCMWRDYRRRKKKGTLAAGLLLSRVMAYGFPLTFLYWLYYFPLSRWLRPPDPA